MTVDTEALKESIDLRAYVMNDLGRPTTHSGGVFMFHCPFHKDRTASFACYANGYWCFGACGKGGDLIAYVQERCHVDFKEALRILGEDQALPKFRRGVFPQAERKPVTLTMADVERYHFDLAKVKSYLDSRMIPDSIRESRMIGGSDYQGRRLDKPLASVKQYIDSTGKVWRFESNWVALPYLFDGTVYSMNFRRDDLGCRESLRKAGEAHRLDMVRFLQIDLAEKTDQYPDEIDYQTVLYHAFGPRFYRPGTRATAYGVDQLIRREGQQLVYPRKPYVILCESEFDKLSCEAQGFTAIAVKATRNVDIRRIVQNTALVFAAIDPDAAGELYASKLTQALGNDSLKVRKMPLPQDFNDMLRAGTLTDFLSKKPYFLEPEL